MAKDDDLRDNNYTDFDDDRLEETNRDERDRMADDTTQGKGVDPQRDIDRRTSDEMSDDDMDDMDNM